MFKKNICLGTQTKETSTIWFNIPDIIFYGNALDVKEVHPYFTQHLTKTNKSALAKPIIFVNIQHSCSTILLQDYVARI